MRLRLSQWERTSADLCPEGQSCRSVLRFLQAQCLRVCVLRTCQLKCEGMLVQPEHITNTRHITTRHASHTGCHPARAGMLKGGYMLCAAGRHKAVALLLLKHQLLTGNDKPGCSQAQLSWLSTTVKQCPQRRYARLPPLKHKHQPQLRARHCCLCVVTGRRRANNSRASPGQTQHAHSPHAITPMLWSCKPPPLALLYAHMYRQTQHAATTRQLPRRPVCPSGNGLCRGLRAAHSNWRVVVACGCGQTAHRPHHHADAA